MSDLTATPATRPVGRRRRTWLWVCLTGVAAAGAGALLVRGVDNVREAAVRSH
jgi:hypothetical protein